MSDLFLNLATLSLGSKVGVQPLVPSLFAPASQPLFGATMQAINDQLAEGAENTIFSIMSPIVADGIGTSAMEQPSDEAVAPEKRTMLTDLVPPDIQQSAISTYPQVDFAEDDASRSSSMYRLLRNADEAFRPQLIQPQKVTLPNTGNSEIMSSSIHQDEQKHSAENSFPAVAADYETQHTKTKDHPVMPTVDAFHDQNLSMPLDKTVAPLPIQPALPVSIPLLRKDDLSEQSLNSDDVLKQKSSLVQIQIQSASIPVHMERFIAPDSDASESVSIVSQSKWRATVDEHPEATSQPLSGLDEHTIKPLPDQNAVAKEREELHSLSEVSTPEDIAQSAKAALRVPAAPEIFHSISPVHPANVHDALDSSRADSKLEEPGAKAESEVFPINITIGRVVVRATQATQPTPMKKRVQRPAQSLDEYLKQRERGSR